MKKEPYLCPTKKEGYSVFLGKLLFFWEARGMDKSSPPPLHKEIP